MANCFHCKKAFEPDYRPGRGDSCTKCGSDVKVCLNCAFFDEAAHNQCREPSAERVVCKDKANFCEFFVLGGGGKGASAEDPLKKLRELFKS